MGKLPSEKWAELTKMSTDRTIGYDQDSVAELECGDLLQYYAEYLLSFPPPEISIGVGVGGGIDC